MADADKIKISPALTAAEKIAYQTALTNLENGQFRQAGKALLKIAGDHPDLAGPQANLGLVYLQTDKPDDAFEHAERSIQLNPALAQGYFLLGLINSHKHDYIEAEKNYRRAIELKKDYENAYYNLALLYDKIYQQPEKAIPHYRTYLKLNGQKDQETIDWVNHLENSLHD